MIVTTDISSIIFKDCKSFGIEKIYQTGNIPKGKVKTERIVIRVAKQSPETYWKKGFVEVNFCVPDIDNKGTANLRRLNEIERLVNSMRNVRMFDSTLYRYSIEKIGVEEDSDLECHYVNVRLLFEVLNVK